MLGRPYESRTEQMGQGRIRSGNRRPGSPELILRVPRRVLQLVLRYILGTDLDRESFEARVAKINDPGTRSAAMTLAQLYRQEGRQEGRQEDILEVLAIRFGHIPEGMREAVHGIEDEATLQKLLRTVIQCQSQEAFADAI